jgi:hypothetical protein
MGAPLAYERPSPSWVRFSLFTRTHSGKPLVTLSAGYVTPNLARDGLSGI